MKIGFLGLGAMGSRMAANLISAGFEVTVWNRTSARAAPLGALGAHVAESPAAAAEGADLVFAMVRDDAASAEIWLGVDGALAAMAEGSVGVECSTLSLPHVAKLSDAFGRAGIGFLDAPLAGSRPQAEAGALIFLAGGDVDTLARVSPALDVMGAETHHAGGIGAGMTVKLMVNALFGVQLSVAAELLGFAEGAGLRPSVAADILGGTPVCSPALRGAMGAMLTGAFAPAFPIDLVEKDFGLLAASSEAVSAALAVSAAARASYQAAQAAGFGGDNITGIVQRYLPFGENAVLR